MASSSKIPSESRKNLNLLLLGMSGSGKTATLKSIVMSGDIDGRGGWDTVVTNSYEQGQINFDDLFITAVDTPSLFSTHMTSQEEEMKQFRKSIEEIFHQFPNGFHALILVISYGRRFGREDTETIHILKEVLGNDWLKTHGIVLVTNGDNFLRDLKETETFEDKCRQIGGQMGQVLKECNYRCVLFDNVNQDQNVVREQLVRLMTAVEKIRSQDCFTLLTNVWNQNEPSGLTIVHQTPAEPTKNLNLLLLGMSGSGKTATLKSIVMSGDIDGQGGWDTVVTDGTEQGQISLDGCIITAVDTPSLFSTRMTSQEEEIKQFRKSIEEIFQQFPNGFHALILVISYGRRFGREDTETTRILKEVLGNDWLKIHGIVLVTKGDNFLRDLKETETFEDKCRHIGGQMGQVLKECNYRCVLFDNVNQDQNVVREQRVRLMTAVDKIRRSQDCFTLQKTAVPSNHSRPSGPTAFEQVQDEHGTNSARLHHQDTTFFEDVCSVARRGFTNIKSKFSWPFRK